MSTTCRARASIILLALALGALSPASASVSAEGEEVGVNVLFDFGEGRWAWYGPEVPEGSTAWNATVEAADALGFELDYTVSDYGIFIDGVDGYLAPEDFSRYWALYTWDEGQGEWASSMVGAVDIAAADGLSVAWQFTSFGDPPPDPNPNTFEPWLEFRGGRADEGQAGPYHPTAGGLRWQRDLGNGAIDSTLAVADGKVFGTSGGIFNWTSFDFEGMPEVFALDADTGDDLWTHPFEGAGGFEIGSPAYHDGVVYAALSSRKVLALDSDDGTLLWEAEVDDEGLSSSPTVAGGKVITGTGSGTVVALETATGEVNWTANVTGPVYLAAPSVHDGVVYLGTDNHTLHALSLENGTELWREDLGGRVRGTPLVTGDRIYAISADYDGFVPVDGRLHALDMTGNELWNVTIGPTGSSPAMLGDLVVVGAWDGLHAVDADGDVAWSHTAGGKVSASPVVSGGTVLIMTNENDEDEGLHTSVVALDAEGEVQWSSELVPWDWALASVSVADWWVYVATDAGHVYCLGDTPLEPGIEVVVDGGHVDLGDDTDNTSAAIVAWEWQLDGTTVGNERGVSLVLNASGTWQVRLTVTDEFGRTATVTKSVTVSLPDLVPGFTFSVDGNTVTLSANATDPDLEVERWNWTVEGAGVTLSGEDATHEFPGPGGYTVTLTVTDEYGREETISLMVTVEGDDDGDESPGLGLVPALVALAVASVAYALAGRRRAGGELR